MGGGGEVETRGLLRLGAARGCERETLVLGRLLGRFLRLIYSRGRGGRIRGLGIVRRRLHLGRRDREGRLVAPGLRFRCTWRCVGCLHIRGFAAGLCRDPGQQPILAGHAGGQAAQLWLKSPGGSSGDRQRDGRGGKVQARARNRRGFFFLVTLQQEDRPLGAEIGREASGRDIAWNEAPALGIGPRLAPGFGEGDQDRRLAAARLGRNCDRYILNPV